MMATHQYGVRGLGRRGAVVVALGVGLLVLEVGRAQTGADAPAVEPEFLIARLQDELEQVSLLLDEERLIRTESAMREHLAEADARGPALAWSLNDAGLLMAREGRLEIAQALFERALQSIEANFGLRHPARGTLLQNLGDILLLRRDPVAADRYREAATLFETVAGTSHPRLASVLNGWATALGSLGRANEAEALYRRSIRIYEDLEAEPKPKRAHPLSGPRIDADSLDLVAPLHNLALLLLDGRRLAESEALLARAYRLLKQHGRQESPQAIPVLRALAKVQRAAGNIKKANSCDFIAERLELKQASAATGDSP